MKKNSILYVPLFLLVTACGGDPAPDVAIPLCLRYDAGLYLRSSGGRTQNGCEAWATALKSGESIYAAKCDPVRLKRLGFQVEKALEFNRSLPPAQQIVPSDGYHMIDYTDSRIQALYGITASRARAHIILNPDQIPVYFRLEGTRIQIEETGISLGHLLDRNASLPEENRIQISDRDLNYVRDLSAQRQYLLGSNAHSHPVAIIFDDQGQYVGHREL